MNFEQLTYSIKDKLFRFSLRITGNQMEAEDVVQEVFIKVWDKRTQMDEVQNPEAYCMTLTKNLSLDKIRSKHRQTMEISEAVYITDSKSTPYQSSEKSDTIGRIKQLMNELPEKQKMEIHFYLSQWQIQLLSYFVVRHAFNIAEVHHHFLFFRQFIH